MATITSTTSGDWATGSTWVGGVAPVAGDDAIIATGHNVTGCNGNIGSFGAAGAGNAIELQGSATLTITGNLTLRGAIGFTTTPTGSCVESAGAEFEL